MSLFHARPRALALSAALLCCAAGALAIPAFPGAEGYGGSATGGRGGDVYHVTNLNTSGVGSFADAIATVPTAGRTIVFDVSGHIHVNKTTLSKSKVTIAGQTAPGDGIGFKDGTFIISGDDIVIRHARFRYGKKTAGGDCIDLSSGTLNAILDQVSIQFSTDENISSFNSPPENLTMQWALNGWGLESHSCGGLWDQNHASCHHSLWAHNHTRNPKARPNGLLEWINNVTYDWDIGFIMGDSETPASWKSNVMGNYFLAPAGNTRTKALEKATVDRNGVPNFSVHLANNRHDSNGDGILNGTDKGYTIVNGSEFIAGDPAGANRYLKSVAPFANTGAVPVTLDDPTVAFKKIVSKAGALRLDVSYTGAIRDEVDARMVSNLVTQTRNHISTETALGLTNGGFGTLVSTAAPVDADKDGMPDFYETALGWNVAAQDHNTTLANSGGFITGTTFFPTGTVAGYTRLEEYLHFLAIPHGTLAKNVAGSPTSIVVNMVKFTSGFSASPTFAVSNIIGGTVALGGTGNAIATFTPTLNYVGRARFEFTVTDSAGHSWAQTCALVVTNSGLPRDLLWKGAGSVWDGAAPNWLRPANGSTVAFSPGDRVAFDQTGIAQAVVSLTGSQAPTTVEVNAAGNYTFAGTGDVSSAGTLTKRGAGTLTIGTSQTYSGGVSLEEGIVAIGTSGSLGGGAVTMLDGTAFTNAYPTENTATLAAPFDVPAGHSATFNTGNRLALTGALTGAGTLNCNVQTTMSRADLKGAMAAFAGNLNFTNSGGVRLFFNGGSFNGFDRASVAVGGLVSLQPQTNSSGNTLNIGALSGTSAGANLAGGSAGAVGYVIGANGTDTAFAGSITDNATLTKTGAGTLTLTGPNTYTGATTVSAGGFAVNGLLASATTVASGATLRGAGTFNGSVTTQTGAQVSPGAGSGQIGTLTAGGGFTATSTNFSMQLSSSPAGVNDRISITGASGLVSGTNNFDIAFAEGTLGAGNYRLIECAAGIPLGIGGGMVMNLTTDAPASTRQSFALNRTASGTAGGYIQLTVTGTVANLVWVGALNSAMWDLATTANFTGAAPGNFFNFDSVTLDDTSANRTVTLAGSLAPRVLNVSTALGYTLTGAGTLDGTGSLAKNGTGTLTLTAAHTFGGGLMLNAGTIALANDTANNGALGTGPVTLNAGVVSMHDDDSSYNAFTANLVVPAGAAARLNADSRVDVYGSLAGAGTLNFYVPWIRTTLFADWSAFTGTINVLTDASGGDFRMGTSYSFPGFPQAALVLPDKVWAYYTGTLSGGAGTTIEIGELSGTALSVLEGGATGGRNFTYRIGGRNTNATFAGTIQEQNTGTTTSYVKTGTGVWTLSGTGTWNGGATVEEGTLKITGAMTCASATNVLSAAMLQFAGGSLATDALDIASNAMLTGNGTITGDLNNGGTVLATTGGTLAVTGDVVNNGTMRIATGTALSATGAFVNNGVLDLLTSSSGLPPNLENNGVVIDSTGLRVLAASKAGGNFSVTVQGYIGHSYQLQRATSLTATWVNVGSSQLGTDPGNSPTAITPLTFTDAGGATGTQRFYRIVVTP